MSVEKILLELKYRALTERTIANRRKILKKFESEIGKPLMDVTRDDIISWVNGRRLSAATQKAYYLCFNVFYKWMGKKLDLPAVKLRMKLLSTKDLVQPEDVALMVQAADHPRDKALIHVLYETGARASELLGMTLNDIEFGDVITKIRFSGKTGDRIVPIIESVPHLQNWINYCGPLKHDEPIWKGRNGGPIKYLRLLQIINRYSLKALGREIPCHRLRHSCATEFAKSRHFNTALLCQRFGWRQNSSVVHRYVRLSGKDLEEATLSKYGIKTEEAPRTESPLKPKPCPRCRNINPAEAKYCSHCSMILDEATALERMKKDQLLMKLIRRLDQMPDEDLKAFLEG